MSDALRQSTGDKVTSSVKPDSQKSVTEQAGDSIKGTADSVAGTLQPEGEKSTTQKASDTVSGGSKDASKEGKTLVGQAQDTLSNAANSVSNALGGGKQ